MKSNELRIGSLVLDDTGKGIMIVSRIESIEYTKWNSGDKYNIICRKHNTEKDYYEGDFFAIPLTEEWLVKFGATKYEFDNGSSNQYRIGERLFVIRNGFICDYGSSVVLKYVHQLQNLYFALTNTELIWNGEK